MDEHPTEHALPAAAAAEFLKTTFELLALYTALSKHYTDQHMPLFSITPKAHYLLHVALKAHIVNPRRSWCYIGEDFMQKMRTLTSSCSKGNKPSEIVLKVCQKYMRAMHLQFIDRGVGTSGQF